MVRHFGYTNISFGEPSHKTFTLFAASRVTVHMNGGFWKLASQQVIETIVSVNGTRSVPREIFPVGTKGQVTHSVRLETGENAIYAKSSVVAVLG